MSDKKSIIGTVKEVGKFVVAIILALVTFSFIRNKNVDKVLEDAEKAKDNVDKKELDIAKVEGKIDSESDKRKQIKNKLQEDISGKSSDDMASELKSRYNNDKR